MNGLKIFNNDELGISVRTMLNDDGSISINAEDTAIGFGWSKTEIKNGKEYTSIRWDRMNGFSADCGSPTSGRKMITYQKAYIICLGSRLAMTGH